MVAKYSDPLTSMQISKFLAFSKFQENPDFVTLADCGAFWVKSGAEMPGGVCSWGVAILVPCGFCPLRVCPPAEDRTRAHQAARAPNPGGLEWIVRGSDFIGALQKTVFGIFEVAFFFDGRVRLLVLGKHNVAWNKRD